jgi:hypothetical protein
VSTCVKAQKTQASTKSARDTRDAAAACLGTACIRVEERTSAAFGELEAGASIAFEACDDVPKGGVLCALPALISQGLLFEVEHYLGALKGYYRLYHILLVIVFE